MSPSSGDCVGIGWRLDPGPTHLDTCYITIAAPKGSFSPPRSSRTDYADGSGPSGGKEILTFMGYIDRGQRIESRFSKRPIRMSGLVIASEVALEPGQLPEEKRATSRFVMEKGALGS